MQTRLWPRAKRRRPIKIDDAWRQSLLSAKGRNLEISNSNGDVLAEAEILMLGQISGGEPTSEAGAMLLGGKLRRVYFPAMGKHRVVWRKSFCYSKSEALEEAQRFAHALLAASMPVPEPPIATPVHWTAALPRSVFKALLKTLRRSPKYLKIEEVKRQLELGKPLVLQRLWKSLTSEEVLLLNDLLGVDLTCCLPVSYTSSPIATTKRRYKLAGLMAEMSEGLPRVEGWEEPPAFRHRED